MKEISIHQIFGYLEIPITIYTPANVNKDKMVIYFHGGGKSSIASIELYRWSVFRMDNRKSKNTSDYCQYAC